MNSVQQLHKKQKIAYIRLLRNALYTNLITNQTLLYCYFDSLFVYHHETYGIRTSYIDNCLKHEFFGSYYQGFFASRVTIL